MLSGMELLKDTNKHENFEMRELKMQECYFTWTAPLKQKAKFRS